MPFNESEFQRWYADQARQFGLSSNPEGQFYDYRAAYKANAKPDMSGHWPSTFKLSGHPNEIVGGFNTRTGERVPGIPQASEQELVRLGWDPENARQMSLPSTKVSLSALMRAATRGDRR